MLYTVLMVPPVSPCWHWTGACSTEAVSPMGTEYRRRVLCGHLLPFVLVLFLLVFCADKHPYACTCPERGNKEAIPYSCRGVKCRWLFSPDRAWLWSSGNATGCACTMGHMGGRGVDGAAGLCVPEAAMGRWEGRVGIPQQLVPGTAGTSRTNKPCCWFS